MRFVVGPSAISRTFPQIHVELLIVGGGVGLLLTGLIQSPLVKISGGHMNPAISLAMWRVGYSLDAGCCGMSAEHGSWPGMDKRWQVNSHIWFQADYGIFYAGRFLRETQPGRNLNYWALWAGCKF